MRQPARLTLSLDPPSPVHTVSICRARACGREVFNLLFICGFQQLVILAFASPAAAALGINSTAPLNLLDAVATVLYAALVLGEAVADKQMFEFQTEKYRRKRAGEHLGEYAHGFVRTGLWGYSRHPNCALACLEVEPA